MSMFILLKFNNIIEQIMILDFICDFHRRIDSFFFFFFFFFFLIFKFAVFDFSNEGYGVHKFDYFRQKSPTPTLTPTPTGSTPKKYVPHPFGGGT